MIPQIVVNLFGVGTVLFYWPFACLALVGLTVSKRKFRIGSCWLSNQDQRSAVKALSEFPVTHHFFTSDDGLKLHYAYKKCEASGPKKGVIVFVHGFPSIWFSWKYQISYFSKRGYDVVCPDMRGYGDSERPVSPWRYEMPNLVKDLDCLLDHLQQVNILKPEHGKPILAGHDWGGVVTSQYALERSSQISKHVLINSSAFKVWYDLVFSNLKQFIMSYYVFCFQIPILAELFICSKGMFKLGGPVKHSEKAHMFATMYPFRNWYHCTGGINFYRANFLWSGVWWSGEKKRRVFGPLRKVPKSTPCQIIWAKGDVYLNVKMAEINQQLYEDCRVTYLKDEKAQHFCIEDNHEEVNQIMLRFLEEQ